MVRAVLISSLKFLLKGESGAIKSTSKLIKPSAQFSPSLNKIENYSGGENFCTIPE